MPHTCTSRSPLVMSIFGGTLLRPKLQECLFGKPAGNIASDFGLSRGPLMLVGLSSHGQACIPRKLWPGPDRPPPRPLFVLADA